MRFMPHDVSDFQILRKIKSRVVNGYLLADSWPPRLDRRGQPTAQALSSVRDSAKRACRFEDLEWVESTIKRLG